MKLNRLFLFIALAVFTVGCYEEHTMVGPRKVYDDQSYEEKFPAALRISIAELKYAFGEISNTGVNSGWSNTIYKLIGDDIFPNEDGEMEIVPKPTTYSRFDSKYFYMNGLNYYLNVYFRF